MIDEYRIKQHDYHNHIQTLLILAKKLPNNLQEIINDYISTDINNNVLNELIKLNNKIIVAFFYSKYNYAEKIGIKIKFNIKNFYLDTVYPDYELVEMYGILMDNAIEATEKLKDNKYIEIYLDWIDKKNHFRVVNTALNLTFEDITKFSKKGFTTKKGENHGVGIYKLIHLVEKRKGTVTYDYDTSFSKIIAEIVHY